MIIVSRISPRLDKRCVFYDLDVRRRVSDVRCDWPLTCLEVLPDGRSVAVGTSSGKVLLYDLRTLVKPVSSIDQGTTAVKAITCQPTEKTAGPKSFLLRESRCA